MRSPMGDGARRLALDEGTLRVAARRTLRACGVAWSAANPGLTGVVTTEGGGVAGSGGEAGLFRLVCRKGCKKKQLKQIYSIIVKITNRKAPAEGEATKDACTTRLLRLNHWWRWGRPLRSHTTVAPARGSTTLVMGVTNFDLLAVIICEGNGGKDNLSKSITITVNGTYLRRQAGRRIPEGADMALRH